MPYAVQHQLRTTYKLRSLWESSRSGLSASQRYLPPELLGVTADEPGALDVLVTSLDVAQTTCGNPVERSSAR